MLDSGEQDAPYSLAQLFEGWDGYQTSLVHAVAPLTPAQLSWRPAPQLRSAGELVRHISLGRLTWFRRMDAPSSAHLAGQVEVWQKDGDGNRQIVESAVDIAGDTGKLVEWLQLTWEMIARTLDTWDVAGLAQTYRYTWNQQTYAISRQWTVWRILAHDIHHGGELSLMLGMQGIEAFELSALGGHITLPPLAEQS
ncbi:MAG: DinB family protein [Anaerolineae bacterium]|nr:DinB family protein [Anaerolineae bacterium]